MLSAATPQLRLLSPEQQAALARFYTPPLSGYLFWLLAWNLALAWLLAQGLAVLFPVPFTAWLYGGALAPIAALRYWSRQRKIKRARFIYEHGQTDYVALTGISANYGLKLNGQPQPVLNLVRSDGQPLRIRTFNERIIQAFNLPRQLVCVYPRYPGVVIPSGLFEAVQPRLAVQDINV